MQRVVLVNPPNHARDWHDLAPPLGLMMLAQIALDLGWEPLIIDFGLPKYLRWADDPSTFYDRAANEICKQRPDLVGLTSMGVNSHVALLIGQEVKRRLPNARLIAGGVHFSSIAGYIEKMYPWIDAVVSGEGELGFAEILEKQTTSRGSQPGCRNMFERGSHPRHPHRAYSHVSLSEYFEANQRRVVNYEAGRGCVYKCAFCYSPAHYAGVKSTPAADVVRDLQELQAKGARHVFMVEDNFINLPRHALAICEAIAESTVTLNWNAYATLPQLNDALVVALASAGCNALYLGIDAVGPNQQITMNKRFFRGNDKLVQRLRHLGESSITPTAAFMVDLFNYDEVESEMVYRAAVACAAVGAPIRLNTFTRYPASRLGARGSSDCRYSEAKVRLMLDCPEVVCRNELAEQAPALFPFHATEIDERTWRHRLRMVWLAQQIISAHATEFEEMLVAPNFSLHQGLARLADMAEGVEAVSSQDRKACARSIVEVY